MEQVSVFDWMCVRVGNGQKLNFWTNEWWGMFLYFSCFQTLSYSGWRR